MPDLSVPPKAAADNGLLTRLSTSSRARFTALCEPCELKFGAVLCEANERLRHVYFPLRGFISLIAADDSSRTLEVGLIGREGLLGATVALDVAAAPLKALVQGDGIALRLSVRRFTQALAAHDDLRALVLRYCFVQLHQSGQAAVCAHYHTVDTRLARWLLMTLDRTVGDELQLTQDFLSQMLGVRRVGVTQAASQLKARGLITYQRGAISVRSRRGLEAIACSCYRADRRAYRRVFP